jgi:glycosyltransferase involved in cell wall biosynthesis
MNDYLFFVDQKTASTLELPSAVNIVVVQTKMSPTNAASASGRRSMGDLWAFSKKVMKFNLDIFYFPAVYTYFPILNRAKKIVTIHDMIADRHPNKVFPSRKLMLFWKIKQYIAVKQAQLLLTVSEYSKKRIIEYYNIHNSHVQVISEGPSSVFTVIPWNQEMHTVLRRFQVYPDIRFLLYVGGISPHKNLRVLVDAYNELIRDLRYSDTKLFLVGDYQTDSFYSDYTSLKSHINQLGLDEKVIFTGYIKDNQLAYFYNAASLLVFPSLEEGFGLPVIEAMACGTPVAASNAGSLPEIVGDAGCLFDPYSKEEMLEIIKRVLSDTDLSKEMRHKGMERARQFSWEKAAKDLLSIFDKLVKDNH